METQRPLAFGVLHLHPWEFGRYTPREYTEKVKGYFERQRAVRKECAQAVANLMNSTGNFKTPVTVDDLLGREIPDRKQIDRQEDMEALTSRFGGR